MARFHPTIGKLIMNRMKAMDSLAEDPGGGSGRLADLLGVVLCGGESRRMGRDKGLLITDGVPWAHRMGEKLKAVGVPVVFSINKGQFESYAAHLPGRKLVVDSLGLAGPMEGLLTVHAEFPQRDLFLLACDLQDLDEGTLKALTDSYVADGTRRAAAYAYSDPAGLQPLCAIYTSALLVRRYEAFRAGEPVDVRLRSLLVGEGIRIMKLVEHRVFRNYNTL